MSGVIEHEHAMRQQAFQFAHVRMDPSATIDEVLKEAEKILAFMKANVQIAVPAATQSK